MNFAELQKLVQYLQQFIPCPWCKTRLQTRGIQVLATVPDSGLLMTQCFQCRMTSFMKVYFTYRGKNKEKYINICIEKDDSVSANDIIDIHTALKNFKGDLRELFFIDERKL